MGSDLIEFLEARIAEDEATAQAATAGPWEWVGDPKKDEAFLIADDGDSVISAYGMHTEGYIECNDADRAHITRNQPARTLAECAAKRAIIESQKNISAAAAKADDLSHQSMLDGMEAGMKMALMALAFPHKDHPDFQQEWTNYGR